jgi:hypothetical protein
MQNRKPIFCHTPIQFKHKRQVVEVRVGDGISAINHRINEHCCRIQTEQRNLEDDAVEDHTEWHKAYTAK